MTLPLPPTLSEVRASALLRAGVMGVPRGDTAALANEKVREAQSELFWHAEWVRQRRTATITLTDSVDTYDIPDDMDLAGLQWAWVQNTDGARARLVLDHTLDIYNNYRNSSGKPMYLWVQDSSLVLTPKPDANWPTLYLGYNMRASTLANDQDRVSVDGEALIQRTAYKLMEALGVGGVTDGRRIDHERYLQRVRAKQRPGQMFNIASDAIDGPAYFDRAGVPEAYVAGWNPWP